MGILGIGDAFSSKVLTAQIFTEDGGYYLVPITKNRIVFGYFFAKLHGRTYAFKNSGQIYSTRTKGGRSVSTRLYFAQSSAALNMEDLNSLRNFIIRNKVKHIDLHAAALLTFAKARGLFQRAKNIPNTTHGKQSIPSELQQDTQNNTEAYSKHLADDVINNTTETCVVDTNHVVNEYVKDMSPQDQENRRRDFDVAMAKLGSKISIAIDSDPIAFLDSRMLGSAEYLAAGFGIMSDMKEDWKIISNPAKGPFKHWIILLILMGISIGGIVLALAATGNLPAGVGGAASLEDFITQAKNAESQGIGSIEELINDTTSNIPGVGTFTDFGSP